MTLVKSLNSGDPDMIPNTRTCKQAIRLASAIWPTYILVQFLCVHVCSCNTCTVGSHVVGSYVDVPYSY